ncbi:MULTISPECIES: hypothetical protein [unclassified Streptomyces]|uniref:hypothetical protein n=1 Tax=unclassified Streptomyces TaxID=2593676 RepID=UPI0018F2B978|nr:MULTISPECIES: hypothetical protein [unclassified Streptomyces]
MPNIDVMAPDTAGPLWDEIRRKYSGARSDRYDEAALDCAGRLTGEPGDVPAAVWALGLVLMAPYVASRPGAGVISRVTSALRSADGTLRARPCPHASHPFDEHGAEDDKRLAARVAPLGDPALRWPEGRPREEWSCPRNAAGFARIALDIIEPDTVADVPPRLPLEAVHTAADLSALLHGYPKPWTDVNDEIAWQASGLATAAPEDRAGHLLIVRAVTWYAVSGTIRRQSVLDDLVAALEGALPFFAGASCAHDRHAELPRSGPAAAELGVMLSSRAGRRLYERRHAAGRAAALETVVCPVFLTEVAGESLRLLRERGGKLFGHRDTSHLDPVYLRPDGRLDIAVIVDRIAPRAANEKYANDLGLWAARRYALAEGRERVALLLTACQSMFNAYPYPPPPVAREVMAVLRAVTAAPRPAECAHAGAHPELFRAEFLAGLPHFYAPEKFPAEGEPVDPEVWMCPGFAGAVAAECLDDLEDLDEEEDAGDGGDAGGGMAGTADGARGLRANTRSSG